MSKADIEALAADIEGKSKASAASPNSSSGHSKKSKKKKGGEAQLAADAEPVDTPVAQVEQADELPP